MSGCQRCCDLCDLKFAHSLSSQSSQAVCSPSQVSGDDPNAFDNRIAISTDTDDFSFTSSDSACLLTPNPSAALLTESPSGSRHSRRTIPPGCRAPTIHIPQPLSTPPINSPTHTAHMPILEPKGHASPHTPHPHLRALIHLLGERAG